MKNLILDHDDPILRQKAAEVPLSDIGSRRITSILNRMKKALHSQEDGVAIAAPQIGESLRIFLVSGRALALTNKKKRSKKDIDAEEIEEAFEDLVFINPVITKLSKKKSSMEEGCLSVRWLYGEVERSNKATIRAYNGKGAKFEMGGSDLMAQIFQHETDHLDGVLFIDKAENIRDLPPKDTDDEE
ncbi:MAG: peptide deformylase, peptide deformylase [Parcubacteria group bacterium]|nr:peptide deformylase, peptide deformylase [Parcubacteria group bacterium]